MKKRDYEAMATFYGLDRMKKRDVLRVTKWLRTTAETIEKYPTGKFGRRFVAKLMQRAVLRGEIGKLTNE